MNIKVITWFVAQYLANSINTLLLYFYHPMKRRRLAVMLLLSCSSVMKRKPNPLCATICLPQESTPGTVWPSNLWAFQIDQKVPALSQISFTPWRVNRGSAIRCDWFALPRWLWRRLEGCGFASRFSHIPGNLGSTWASALTPSVWMYEYMGEWDLWLQSILSFN